jgi:hypothetical protein
LLLTVAELHRLSFLSTIGQRMEGGIVMEEEGKEERGDIVVSFSTEEGEVSEYQFFIAIDVPAFYEECIALRSTLLGYEHPLTLTARTLYAHYLSDQYHSPSINSKKEITASENLYEKAYQLYQECYEIRLQQLAETHEETIQSMLSFALIQLSRPISTKKEDSKQTNIMGKVYELALANLGPNHRYTISSLNNLAALRVRDNSSTNQVENESPGKQLVLAAQQLETACQCLFDLTSVEKITKTDSSIPQHTNLLPSRLSCTNPEALRILYNLARVYERVERQSEAWNIYIQIYQQYSVRLGKQHPHTLLVFKSLILYHFRYFQANEKHWQEDQLKLNQILECSRQHQEQGGEDILTSLQVIANITGMNSTETIPIEAENHRERLVEICYVYLSQISQTYGSQTLQTWKEFSLLIERWEYLEQKQQIQQSETTSEFISLYPIKNLITDFLAFWLWKLQFKHQKLPSPNKQDSMMKSTDKSKSFLITLRESLEQKYAQLTGAEFALEGYEQRNAELIEPSPPRLKMCSSMAYIFDEEEILERFDSFNYSPT